jgi:hypothetical protein
MTHPRVLVVMENITPGVESERKIRNILFEVMKKKITKNVTKRFSIVNIIIVFFEGKRSVQIRYRWLKKYLIEALN